MSNTWKIVSRGVGAILLCTFVFAGAASAQTTRPSTVATFSGPVRLPNMLLPAGTYTFAEPAWSQSQDIVAIFNDRNEFVTVVRVIRSARRSTGPAVILVSNRADAPPSISAVYYTGSTTGYEFVYNNRPAGTLLAQKDAAKR